MRHLLPGLFFLLPCFSMRAQTAKDIITEMQSINQLVSHRACGTDSAAAISNRAMSIFLADKTAYLSSSTDIFYFTNYATLNSTEGKVTLTHNFQIKPGIDAPNYDDPQKKMLIFGFDLGLASNYTKSFLDNRFENQLGFTTTYVQQGKVRTTFADCAGTQQPNQKQIMDGLRTVLAQELAREVLEKDENFTANLTIDSTTAEGQHIQLAKAAIQKNFYTNLKAEYEEKYAAQQAQLLTETANYKLVSTCWTSFSAYIPTFFPTYRVAASLSNPFTNKHPYPVSISLSHTRLWESTKTGKWFLTISGNLLANNSKLSYDLNKLSFGEYKSLGGTDNNEDPGNNKLYIGPYKNYFTPSLKGRLVYYPGVSHIGLTLLAEQNFGDYNFLNAKVGIPLIIINSKEMPVLIVEFYALFLNITNQEIHTAMPGKTLLGFSFGIPLSKFTF